MKKKKLKKENKALKKYIKELQDYVQELEAGVDAATKGISIFLDGTFKDSGVSDGSQDPINRSF